MTEAKLRAPRTHLGATEERMRQTCQAALSLWHLKSIRDGCAAKPHDLKRVRRSGAPDGQSSEMGEKRQRRKLMELSTSRNRDLAAARSGREMEGEAKRRASCCLLAQGFASEGSTSTERRGGLEDPLQRVLPGCLETDRQVDVCRARGATFPTVLEWGRPKAKPHRSDAQHPPGRLNQNVADIGTNSGWSGVCRRHLTNPHSWRVLFLVYPILYQMLLEMLGSDLYQSPTQIPVEVRH